MIDQVLLGYNCTIFAYGQTGAGKTFTMEGDLSGGEERGIIPRTLYTLFHHLDGFQDFSVRVSYLELYNEELKDLLSSSDVKLKMYEDLNRKGSVLVMGIEEVLVKSAEDVFEVLKRGSLKRSMASTKMNDTSSRSHGIFTITVHIKESTSDGEELLKVGKLHLVDLAGSENIGRSGAVERRAKEAGMINQSLLTLGRVINALVERSPHVPYRESKLTRILQDSLGGRTKTCIIANISPAKDSIEETLSTLDYAYRAKNIKNKPEVNQKLTKRSLIKDYVSQIDRLKSDLVASREKNGIFLSPESYNMLVEENVGNKTQVEEFTKMMASKASEYELMTEKFSEQSLMLSKTNSSLNQAMGDLEVKRQEFEELVKESLELERRLNEQEFFTLAHHKTEMELDSLAIELQSSLRESVVDNEGLHMKMERKRKVEEGNLELFGGLQNGLRSEFDGLLDSSKLHLSLNLDTLKSFEGATKAYRNDQEVVGKALQSDFEEKKNNLKDYQNGLQGVRENIKVLLEELKSKSESACLSISNQFRVTNEDLKSCKDAIILSELINLKGSELESEIDNIVILMDSYYSTAIDLVARNQIETSTLLKSEIETLRIENILLKEKEKDTREKLNRGREMFMEELSGSFMKYNKTIDSTLDFAEQEIALQKHSKNLERSHTNTVVQTETLKENLMNLEGIKERLQGASKGTVKDTRSIQDQISALQAQLDRELARNTTILDESLQASNVDIQISLDASAKEIARVIEYTDNIDSTHQKSLQNHSNSTNQITQALEIISNLMNSTPNIHRNITESIQRSNNLLTQDLIIDNATGSTPRKKVVVTNQGWELTKSHIDLAQEFNEMKKENEAEVQITSEAKEGRLESKLPIKKALSESN